MWFSGDPELLLARGILPLSLWAGVISLLCHPTAVALESLTLLILIIECVGSINILRLRPQKFLSVWCYLEILAAQAALNRFLRQPLSAWPCIRLLSLWPQWLVWFSQRELLRALIDQLIGGSRVSCWCSIQGLSAWIWRLTWMQGGLVR